MYIHVHTHTGTYMYMYVHVRHKCTCALTLLHKQIFLLLGVAGVGDAVGFVEDVGAEVTEQLCDQRLRVSTAEAADLSQNIRVQ